MITDSDDDRIKTVFSDFVNKFCINLTSDYTSFLKRRHSLTQILVDSVPKKLNCHYVDEIPNPYNPNMKSILIVVFWLLYLISIN
jgi:hypothetical protein